MGMSTGNSGGSLSEINVTPLVDVMLVLLIIFMVTAPMIEPPSAKVELPNVETGQTLDQKDRFLTLEADIKGVIWIGKTGLKLSELTEKLKHNPKIKQDRKVYLRADRRLKYRHILKIMIALRKAGVMRIDLVTDPTRVRLRPLK